MTRHHNRREDNGDPIDCSRVVWSQLGATCTVSADADPASGGFSFVSSLNGTVTAKATVDGVGYSVIPLTFREMLK